MMLKITIVGDIAHIETDANLKALVYNGVVPEDLKHPTEEQSKRDDHWYDKGCNDGYNKATIENNQRIHEKEIRIKELEELLHNTRPKPKPEPTVEMLKPEPDVETLKLREQEAKDRYHMERIIYETRKSECMRAIWKDPDHNGYLPPGMWKMTQNNFNRLTRQNLIEHLNGWILKIRENGSENIEDTFYVKIPENMPANGNLTDYLKSLPKFD